jgi:hypothetical protein
MLKTTEVFLKIQSYSTKENSMTHDAALYTFQKIQLLLVANRDARTVTFSKTKF